MNRITRKKRSRHPASTAALALSLFYTLLATIADLLPGAATWIGIVFQGMIVWLIAIGIYEAGKRVF